ncbi:MAG TPA: hypothetical protein VIH05_07860 [Tepidiformaceae bacterium]
MSASHSTTDLATSAYQQLADRLRLNFVVAVWTNILFVVILVASAIGAAAFMAMGQVVPATILGGLSIVDLAYGIAEKPWKELLTANNRLALAQSVWIGYVDAKQAINEGVEHGARPAVLGMAQNLWIFRTAVIAQDNYEAVVNELRDIDGRFGAEVVIPEEVAEPLPEPVPAGNGHDAPPIPPPAAAPLPDLAIEEIIKSSAAKRPPAVIRSKSTDWIGAAQQAYREGSERTNTG